MSGSAPTILLSANSDWNIANFRGGLFPCDGSIDRTAAGGTAANGQAGRGKVQEQFNEDFVVKAYLDVVADLDMAKPGI